MPRDYNQENQRAASTIGTIRQKRTDQDELEKETIKVLAKECPVRWKRVRPASKVGRRLR